MPRGSAGGAHRSASTRYAPRPAPVPPATLWSSRKPLSWSHASACAAPGCASAVVGSGGSSCAGRAPRGAAARTRGCRTSARTCGSRAPSCCRSRSQTSASSAHRTPSRAAGCRALQPRPPASCARQAGLRARLCRQAPPPRLGLHVNQNRAGGVHAMPRPEERLRRASGEACANKRRSARACRVAAPKSSGAASASAASALNSAEPSWLPHWPTCTVTTDIRTCAAHTSAGAGIRALQARRHSLEGQKSGRLRAGRTRGCFVRRTADGGALAPFPFGDAPGPLRCARCAQSRVQERFCSAGRLRGLPWPRCGCRQTWCCRVKLATGAAHTVRAVRVCALALRRAKTPCSRGRRLRPLCPALGCTRRKTVVGRCSAAARDGGAERAGGARRRRRAGRAARERAERDTVRRPARGDAATRQGANAACCCLPTRGALTLSGPRASCCRWAACWSPPWARRC